MKKLVILIIISTSFFIGCNNSNKDAEYRRDSIMAVQNEKITQLQQELENSKAKAKEEPKPIEDKKEKEVSFFTIGSTENEVLKVQGEPSSIIVVPPDKAFYYGSSYVNFRNGNVESYSNSGNLRIRIVPSYSVHQSQSQNTEPVSGKTKSLTKYVYFDFLTDDVWQNDYSKIYEITGYTYEKQESLQFCLEIAYKQWTGKKVTLGPQSFDDRQSAFASWNNEKETIFQDACGALMQSGIFAQ